LIPSNHKWFRNLAVSQIICATLEDMGMKMPEPSVDIAAIGSSITAPWRKDEEPQASPPASRGEAASDMCGGYRRLPAVCRRLSRSAPYEERLATLAPARRRPTSCRLASMPAVI
jgi:hypothetical protein